MRILPGTLLTVALVAGSIEGGFAQSPLKFDVASVKPSPDPRSVPVFSSSPGAVQPGGTWRAQFATVDRIIRALYPDFVLPGQITGGPPWVATDMYDITAKADPARTAEEFNQMARALLAERFNLVTHIEKRELPVYFLVLARRDGRLGPGLRSPAVDCDAYRAARARGEPIPPDLIAYGTRLPCAATVMPVMSQHQIVPGTTMRLTAGSRTIPSLVAMIAGQVGRPVLDRTGLTQLFDVEVQFSPPRPPTVGNASIDEGPRFTTALEEQAGLKLEEGRATADVLVIDRVDRPTPD
jgi:uncharacterized protein (TIGR03435 family)